MAKYLITKVTHQIRGLAWPAVLIGWVAQSASLGMKDSWGPLKALTVASAIIGIGDIVLCRFLGYGIVGAAWATMVSRVVATFMMIDAVNNKGYNGFAISVPSSAELLQILMLAAPVFLTMTSKVTHSGKLISVVTDRRTLIFDDSNALRRDHVKKTGSGSISQESESLLLMSLIKLLYNAYLFLFKFVGTFTRE